MRKIENTLLINVGKIAACLILCFFVPFLREPMLIVWDATWQVFKLFFLDDTIKHIIIYIIIAAFVGALGYGISSKTENKIWVIASMTVDIIGIISYIAICK